MTTEVAQHNTPASTRESDAISRLWGTNVSLGKVELGDTVPRFDELGSGPPFEILDLATLPAAVRDEIESVFLETMQALTAADRAQGIDVEQIDHVELSLQIWRGGYELPISMSAGPYLGWLFLSGTLSQHSDSGTVAVLDPRAGASMSAVPGMPWGTVLTIRPERGNLAIVPGWLTSSVLPLEEQQTCVVVAAEARRRK
ncbi:hypothetical protein ACIGO9_31580 [Nocardia asteroides]|uniref:hypothetical protein n=1 Tax=Nocardia asteroides TaxID=1824 RepID=UPI0037C5EB7A